MMPVIGKKPENININNIKVEAQNSEHIEEETSIYEKFIKKADNNTSVDNQEEIRMEDFFAVAKQSYEEFDERAYKKGNGYKCPGFPAIEKHLEGLETGMYLFSGESNSGKSAAMMNIIKNICSCEENNLFGIYYSLDDSKNEIIPRIVAMEQSIPIGVVAKPNRFKEMIEFSMDDNGAMYAEFLEKRELGLEKLKSESNSFLIEDANKIKNTTDIKNHIKMVKAFLKSHYEGLGDYEKAEKINVIIAIDALNDIRLDPKVYGRVKKDEQAEEVAKFVKDLTTEFDIIVFASTHLRKLNGNRRPVLDDLREANTLVYEASVVWLVYNDVSKNKGGAKIYFNDQGEPGPILEMDWAKNKKSSYKGRTFNMFRPNLSQIKECTDKDMQSYEALILQS